MMVDVTMLWLPIIVAAVLVFVASSIIHMVLPYHRSDYGRVPSEDQAMDALRPFKIPPGDYMVPCPAGPESMKSKEHLEKMNKGPVVFMTVLPTGQIGMGRNLVLWFIFCLVVGLFSGYIAGVALPPGADYMAVFRITGTVAFVGYSMALWENVVWYNKSVATTLKSTFDGLIYGLLTAGAFGWLWP